MRIVLTGGTGFIGSHLIARLAKRHEIFALARNPENVAGPPNVIPVHADLLGPLNTLHLPESTDVVAHLAQHNGGFPQEARELFAVNTVRTQELLSYAVQSGARQFVLASTGDVYGYRLSPCRETDPVSPASFYAATKRSSELLTQAYENYLAPTILRLFTPYGPGQVGRLVPNLAARIGAGQAVRFHRGNRPMLSPTYIEDVMQVFETVIETHAPGLFNVAGPDVVSVRELAEAIGGLLGKEPLFEETNEDVGNMLGDNTHLKTAFRLPALTKLHDGLRLTFAAHRR